MLNQNPGIKMEQILLSPAACPDHFGSGGGEVRAGGGHSRRTKSDKVVLFP